MFKSKDRTSEYNDRQLSVPAVRQQNVKEPKETIGTKKISKKVLVIFFCLVVLGLLELTLIAWRLDHPQTKNDAPAYGTHKTSNSQPGFDKKKFSVNESSSLWVVVNKGRILPVAYVPVNLSTPNVALRTYASDPEMQLRKEASVALEKMFSEAAGSGIKLRLASGYRSYSEQVSVYASEVKNSGQVAADRESARPGHSEHQTGLAADVEPLNRVCELNQCFENTPEGKWLSANSYKYGYIIRYTKNDEGLTGYKYEPWHIRYLGNDLAAEIHRNNQTLEQFFNLSFYTTYPHQNYQLKYPEV